MPTKQPHRYFYQIMGETIGPISSDELKQRAADGTITPDMLIRRDGEDHWHQADRFKGLFDATLRSSNPSPASAGSAQRQAVSPPPVALQQAPQPPAPTQETTSTRPVRNIFSASSPLPPPRQSPPLQLSPQSATKSRLPRAPVIAGIVTLLLAVLIAGIVWHQSTKKVRVAGELFAMLKNGDAKRGAGVTVVLSPLTPDARLALDKFADENAKTQADFLARLAPLMERFAAQNALLEALNRRTAGADADAYLEILKEQVRIKGLTLADSKAYRALLDEFEPLFQSQKATCGSSLRDRITATANADGKFEVHVPAGAYLVWTATPLKVADTLVSWADVIHATDDRNVIFSDPIIFSPETYTRLEFSPAPFIQLDFSTLHQLQTLQRRATPSRNPRPN